MKLHDIRLYVAAGVPVYYMTDRYTVEPIGTELIVRNINTHDQFFLTDLTGIMLNGREEWFYKEKETNK